MKELTKQAMFDRAWRGLEAQGWRVADSSSTGCSYYIKTLAGEVLRCAWGHVDPEGTTYVEEGVTKPLSGSVRQLRESGAGIAARLPAEDLAFAVELQDAHDWAPERRPRALQTSMRFLAEIHGLTIPVTKE